MVFCLDPSSRGIGRSISSAPSLFTPSVRAGIGIDADDFRLSPTASSDRFSFHLLRPDSPLIAGYWSLRRSIFCEEQHVFEQSDRDELDRIACPIAALHHGCDPELEQERREENGLKEDGPEAQVVGVVVARAASRVVRVPPSRRPSKRSRGRRCSSPASTIPAPR